MTTKTVTSSALQRRINRALSHHGQVLKKCREGSRYYHERGDYYIVDVQTGGISETHVDLEALASELNILNDYEVQTEPEHTPRKQKMLVSEKEFAARARQMQREFRVIERRQKELIKKYKQGCLTQEEQAELDQSFKDSAKKAADNVDEMLRLGGFEWLGYRRFRQS